MHKHEHIDKQAVIYVYMYKQAIIYTCTYVYTNEPTPKS